MPGHGCFIRDGRYWGRRFLLFSRAGILRSSILTTGIPQIGALPRRDLPGAFVRSRDQVGRRQVAFPGSFEVVAAEAFGAGAWRYAQSTTAYAKGTQQVRQVAGRQRAIVVPVAPAAIIEGMKECEKVHGGDAARVAAAEEGPPDVEVQFILEE